MIALLSAVDRIILCQPILGQTFWAALDVLVHGAVALVVAGPCIRRAQSARRAITLSGLAFLSATVLDLDHFAAAGSLDVRAALALAARPPTHSLTFALLFGAVLSRLSRDHTAGWVAFVALASHVLRDAAMGTAPLLWPLAVDKVPLWAYACGELGLAWASCAWKYKVLGTCPSEEILPAPDGLVLR
jgi:membrane-bound metal-dependent hydrolase YbcI (DUF457 family)